MFFFYYLNEFLCHIDKKNIKRSIYLVVGRFMRIEIRVRCFIVNTVKFHYHNMKKVTF